MKSKSGLRQSGFSLLEIIGTVLLLSLGILGIMRSLNMVLALESQMNNRRTALMLGEEKMEEIKSAPSYAAVDNFAVPRGPVGEFASFEREVVIGGDPKEIRVNVYWGPTSDEQTLQLVTLMTDYNF
jgi:hypothetical protein